MNMIPNRGGEERSLILIPTYNEAQNIRDLITSIFPSIQK